ncbi:hypothetical protein FISHEDRAFT_66640 [Fistulina hepatica ATCC 64428]|uniref:3-hydroxybutyryl-CoA dehydrogenase n=1 Tax=Fistulina hepatica ATCC 64428 TaxID=1128425 RepID=A0A0D7A762_9AGAR|nr:hypothetical protein FISHEDRAFT_66640 [Fistulina hepatica ATCC 64428]
MVMAATHGIRRMAVLGAGQMGSGIAYVAAVHARAHVVLYDKSSAQVTNGLALLHKLLDKDVNKGRITKEQAAEARERIVPLQMDGSGYTPLRDLDMVVEAVSENLSLKQKIFTQLAIDTNPSTILASNTSSISITKLAAAAIPESASAASDAGLQSAGRVVGLHFFNPVPVMKLVELIPGLQTTSDTLSRVEGFARDCGKEVTKSRDVPGFIANALLMPFLNEAIMCLESGVATREDIDKTMRLGTNHPMGPLELADFIGLDTCLAIQQTLHTGTGDTKYRSSILLERMVDAGWLGRKSGRGFYEYPSK